MIDLRELDARVIPDLARRVQEIADRVRRTHEAGAARVAQLRPAPAPVALPAGPAPTILRLRALDAKYADRGPLALMRELPQLGALLLALLILVSGVAVKQRREPPQQVVATTPADTTPIVPGLVDGGTVGPEIGDNVLTYLQKADRELQDRLVADPAERAFATVSFVDYRTPADALKLLGDTPTFRAFFRVPGKYPTDVEATPVKVFVRDVVTAYETIAAKRRADIPDLIGQAQTTEDQVYKDYYELTARQYLHEAEQLERGCACVFAVAVIAPLDQLRDLRKTPGIRVVDLAPSRSQLDTIVFRGLRPDEKVTVTNGNEKPTG
jgi:hypothetical protein